jgi:hypothetical protein
MVIVLEVREMGHLAALEVLAQVEQELVLARSAAVERGLQLDDLVDVADAPPAESVLCNSATRNVFGKPTKMFKKLPICLKIS